MGMKARANVATFFKYFVLIFMGFIMVYPLLWMVGSTFKTNAEIFTSLSPFTAHPTLDGYYNAVTKTYGGDITIWRAFLNTYSYVIPKVVFTVISSVIAAYGFMRSIPHDLDEAAAIDGCGPVKILYKIICPMLSPSLVACALFQFMWSCNDFMGPLLYVTTPRKYPMAIFVKLSMDSTSEGIQWNRILALSLISIIPQLLVFFAAQDSFIDGIAAGSVKG